MARLRDNPLWRELRRSRIAQISFGICCQHPLCALPTQGDFLANADLGTHDLGSGVIAGPAELLELTNQGRVGKQTGLPDCSLARLDLMPGGCQTGMSFKRSLESIIQGNNAAWFLKLNRNDWPCALNKWFL